MDFQIDNERKIIKDNDRKYDKQSNYCASLLKKSKRLYYSDFDQKILQLIKLFRKPFLFDKKVSKEKINFFEKYEIIDMGVMHRVFRLQLGPNFGVRLTADKNLCWRLAVEKTHVFAVFMEKYLRSYGCSGTNFAVTANCTNPKTEIQIEIIKKQINNTNLEYKSNL